MLDYRAAHGMHVKMKSRIAGAAQCIVSRYGLKFCDHVVCSNQKDVNYLLKAGFCPEMLTRHFSGVDEQMLNLGKNGCSHGSGGILFLGIWIERKGIWDIVPAVTRILREKPQTFFTVAGCLVDESDVFVEFPDDVRGRIKVIRSLSTAEELAAIYKAHSVFLLPSYFEGQPLVMMESAAFGLAIVTTPVCGMLDFIRHDFNGLFVPVGDSNAIESAIRKLIDYPEQARLLGAAARCDVEKHTWQASACNLAKTYKQLVGKLD
jgi:glycosyltransferase involved in cell wall biosynthesis